MINDYNDFIKKVYDLTDIDLSMYKPRQMKRRIDSLISKNNSSNYNEYYKKITTDENLLKEFINYLTINVSQFFRNPAQWDILRSNIIPKIMESNENLKMWNAGCATGEEPYSLVMTMADFMPLTKIKVLATDIDEEVLIKAKVGKYNDKSLENLPKTLKNKYFYEKKGMYYIKNEIKDCVVFRKHNLLSDPYPSNCDLIICRNVLIYFTEEAKDKLYKKFYNALKPGGVFFVGSTEQIIFPRKYGFIPIRTFFYKRPDDKKKDGADGGI
ncbi:MAG TPA: protein-glutamate O-methyltransferase CheR [Clostridiales bacterium]|nr:protein-glutamate O-methyltransferase CheR [Clostridiales bacterium]